jgi:hypothetical protein
MAIRNTQSKKIFIENDTTVIIELHPNEIYLIRSLRTKFRFGEVTIMMRDGLPMRWKRITEFDQPPPLDKQS